MSVYFFFNQIQNTALGSLEQHSATITNVICVFMSKGFVIMRCPSNNKQAFFT